MRFFFFFFSIFFIVEAKAQSGTFQNIFYANQAVYTDSVQLVLKDIVSVREYTKFRLEIINNSSNQLVLNEAEITFQFQKSTLNPKKKIVVIPSHETYVTTIKCETFLMEEPQFTIGLDALHFVKSIGKMDYKYSSSNKNTDTIKGVFEVKQNKSYQWNDCMAEVVEVTYRGYYLAIVNFKNIKLLANNGFSTNAGITRKTNLKSEEIGKWTILYPNQKVQNEIEFTALPKGYKKQYQIDFSEAISEMYVLNALKIKPMLVHKILE
jgi:uncharacterized protein Veg